MLRGRIIVVIPILQMEISRPKEKKLMDFISQCYDVWWAVSNNLQA